MLSPIPARRLIIDHEHQRITVVAPDGTVRVARSRGTVPPGAIGLVRSDFDTVTRELHLTLPTREVVTIEVGGTDALDHSKSGRLIVYLDQNHWRTLARARSGGDGLLPRQLAAARTVIDLVRAKRIVVPISSAHAYETGRTYGALRRELATAMLDLSRGWTLRNPIRIRRTELACAMSGRQPRDPRAVTLNPDGFFGPGGRSRTYDTVETETSRTVLSRLTLISSIADVMMEDDPEDPQRARDLASRWSAAFEELSRRLNGDRAPRSVARSAVFLNVLADLGDDLAAAALGARVSQEDLSTWMLDRAAADIEVMPFLGHLYRLLVSRVRNVGERWERNDLTDALFLSCATGYADVVVGERRHIHHLRQTRVGTGAHVFRRLEDAAAWLDARTSQAAVASRSAA